MHRVVKRGNRCQCVAIIATYSTLVLGTTNIPTPALVILSVMKVVPRVCSKLVNGFIWRTRVFQIRYSGSLTPMPSMSKTIE